MTKIAPFGSWTSPITPELLTEAAVTIGTAQADAGSVWWMEQRPLDGGRVVVVRDGSDVLAAPFSARTTVHEYGGGAFVAAGGTLYFSNFADQRLYRVEPGGESEAITPDEACRYADARVCPDGRWLVCVREDHRGEGEAVNELVVIPVDGSAAPRVIAGGHDFIAAPRISADGRRLAWITWNHPDMPWDATDLWVADIGDGFELGAPEHVAGGPGESVVQPEWNADGVLHFASDRSGWWNLYRADEKEPLVSADAEFAGPAWGLGMAWFDVLGGGSIACTWTNAAGGHLGVIEDGALRELATGFTSFRQVRADGDDILVIAGSPTVPGSLLRVQSTSGKVELIRREREIPVDAAFLSQPEAIEFPTEGGLTAHAFYYPPTNPDFTGPDGEPPPVLVISHGGPTGSTSSVISLGIQFWTSRGIAVVDVNYGGSSGYGRAYRERLKDAWGIVDLADCVNAARFLADRGDVDVDRLLIRGGSAGGYTTLCALTFTDAFAAGASYYGVGDLGALARDTHKFESRYLDGLVGPWPEAEEIYRARSPIFHTDQLESPVILFQGLDDKVVPPAQAEEMVAALSAKGVKHAYVPFEGEAHGFRKAENIQRAYREELAFYGEVLGFSPA